MEMSSGKSLHNGESWLFALNRSKASGLARLWVIGWLLFGGKCSRVSVRRRPAQHFDFLFLAEDWLQLRFEVRRAWDFLTPISLRI